MNARLSFHAAVIVAALTGRALFAGTTATDWSDRPVKIIQTYDAQFPTVLAVQGISQGEVRAVLNVDSEGKFADCLIIGYTHPEMAAEVLAAVHQWQYEPAYVRGEPTGTRLELSFSFEARGQVISLNPIDTITSGFGHMIGTKTTSLVCKPTELDEPLLTRRIVRPLHPGKTLHPAQLDGSVMLDFYIDSTGRPRMPVVLRATHTAFALAVVDALAQWRYEPPRRNGRPVVVRVQQEFVFSGRS